MAAKHELVYTGIGDVTFVNTISPEVASLKEIMDLEPISLREIERGLSTIYGPYLGEMVRYAKEAVKKGNLDGQLAGAALGIAGSLFYQADMDYRQGENSVLSGEDLETHQKNVLAGNIIVIPQEFWTTPEQGIEQVIRANTRLNIQDIQATLAAINYGAFFQPQTMASAARTRAKSEIDQLLADSTQKEMPHLTVSNWAIGQIVAGIYQHLAEQGSGKLRVFDIGSGTGSTIAAITSCIGSLPDLRRQPGLSITAFETTPEFCDELVGFAGNDKGIADLHLKSVVHDWNTGNDISKPGKLTIVKGNACNSLIRSNADSGVSDYDITVITANYSFHRLGNDTKATIINLFSSLPNVVFVIGDLKENGSVVNRGYFNLGVNGPLNCGNRELSQLFYEQDLTYNVHGSFNPRYHLVDLTAERPSLLDYRIAARINKDSKNNDGHLWIAYRGELAEKALHLVSVA